MKTLHLTLKKKWFDMIDSGEKSETQDQLENEVSANFRLIASSPEMLEMLVRMKDALLELMDYQDGWDDDYIELETLIKKATEQ